MTDHKLDIHTSTRQDIDNYVNTLTGTITKVHSKTLKPNSAGLPQSIIRENRRQRRFWQQTKQQHYKADYNRQDKTMKQYISQTR